MHISYICVQIIYQKVPTLQTVGGVIQRRKGVLLAGAPPPSPPFSYGRSSSKAYVKRFRFFLMKLAVGIFKTLATYIRLNSDSVSNCIVL